MPDGTVYVLTNDSFPDLVKVGFTTRSASVRAKELSTTGVPHAFQVFYETPSISNYREIERRCHESFKQVRVNNGREFFRVDPENVRQELINLMSNVHVVTVQIPDGVEEIMLRIERTTLS